MSNAENDSPMLGLQLMIAKQEKDMFKHLYLITSKNLVSRSRG